MALSKLSGDEQGIILGQLCNPLEPRLVVYFSSASSELRVLLTPALLQQLRADHEAAAALCLKMGMRSCKELREATRVHWLDKGLSAADLTTLGTLGSVLPRLSTLTLNENSAGPDGMQRLAEGLGTGALPSVSTLSLSMHMGDAGALALAAALGRGALPRLTSLSLNSAAIGDAGLVALAPALRRMPALESLCLHANPLGDEGIAALVAPPLPAGAPPPPTGVLTKLKQLYLGFTQVSDAGCTTLAFALDSDALLALEILHLGDTPASAAATAAVYEARANLQDGGDQDELLEELRADSREMCGMVGVQPGDLLEHHTLDYNNGGWDNGGWDIDTFTYIGAADGATRTPVGWHVFRWLEEFGGRGICADGPGSHAGLNGGMRDVVNAWPMTEHYNYRADGTFDDHELALPPGACLAFRRSEEWMDDEDEEEE
eukprot:scaffold92907_cov63-Phaeocystis_antarctica.AAC.2